MTGAPSSGHPSALAGWLPFAPFGRAPRGAGAGGGEGAAARHEETRRIVADVHDRLAAAEDRDHNVGPAGEWLLDNIHVVQELDRCQLRAAAQLRARYRIRTPDALQLAAALSHGCAAFLLRVPGKGRGKWRVGRNFDAPLPDAVARDFEGDR